MNTRVKIVTIWTNLKSPSFCASTSLLRKSSFPDSSHVPLNVRGDGECDEPEEILSRRLCFQWPNCFRIIWISSPLKSKVLLHCIVKLKYNGAITPQRKLVRPRSFLGLFKEIVNFCRAIGAYGPVKSHLFLCKNYRVRAKFCFNIM